MVSAELSEFIFFLQRNNIIKEHEKCNINEEFLY